MEMATLSSTTFLSSLLFMAIGWLEDGGLSSLLVLLSVP